MFTEALRELAWVKEKVCWLCRPMCERSLPLEERL